MTPTEHRLTVERTARFCTLGPLDRPPAEVWFALHGYGQLAPYFIRHFAPLDDGTRLIVAPEGLSRFYLRGVDGRIGASWMTKEARSDEIADQIGFLDRLHEHVFVDLDRAAVHVTVFGFSQGCATACRWLDRSAIATADRLILWAGLIPPDVDLTRPHLADDRLTMVLGHSDEYAVPERTVDLRARLAAAGRSPRHITFPGGHRLDADVLRQIARRNDE